MTDITIIIPLHDISSDYIEMTKIALDSVKECEKNYAFGKLIPMIVIPQDFDGAVASKPMTSVMGRIATDEPRRGLCKNKDLNNFGVSENTTGKGVSPDGSRGKTGGVTPSGGSGDGYEASYPAPSKNPMTSVVGVRQQPTFEGIEVKYVVNTTGKYDFCSQVNFAVDSVETEFFSILECDDTYAPKWFKMAHDYYKTNEDVGVFLPVNIQWNNGRAQWQYNNEIALASSFSNDMGFIDKDGLDVCSTFNLTGAIINTKNFIEVGKYKPSIKFAFNYELMLRFADNGKKMMVVPKEGYNHHVGRENSLTDIYAKEIPESEIQLWFDLAKREYPYKIDRWKTIVMPKQEQLK